MVPANLISFLKPVAFWAVSGVALGKRDDTGWIELSSRDEERQLRVNQPRQIRSSQLSGCIRLSRSSFALSRSGLSIATTGSPWPARRESTLDRRWSGRKNVEGRS